MKYDSNEAKKRRSNIRKRVRNRVRNQHRKRQTKTMGHNRKQHVANKGNEKRDDCYEENRKKKENKIVKNGIYHQVESIEIVHLESGGIRLHEECGELRAVLQGQHGSRGVRYDVKLTTRSQEREFLDFFENYEFERKDKHWKVRYSGYLLNSIARASEFQTKKMVQFQNQMNKIAKECLVAIGYATDEEFVHTMISFLRTKEYEAQMPHVDYDWNTINGGWEKGSSEWKSFVPFIAFFPLTYEGMLIQVWPEREDGLGYDVKTVGKVFKINFGTILFVRGDVVHAGGFQTYAGDTNPRGHAYVWKSDKSKMSQRGCRKYFVPPVKHVNHYGFPTEEHVLLKEAYVHQEDIDAKIPKKVGTNDEPDNEEET